MNLLETVKIRLYTLFKIPLINYVGPRVIQINNERCEAVIPLTRRTRNHVHSVYFGALAVGADMCIGLLALRHVEKSGKKIVLIFKDFHADFRRLAKGDAHFICAQGKAVKDLIQRTIQSGRREHATINGYATTPRVSGDEVVMKFTLTLSAKPV